MLMYEFWYFQNQNMVRKKMCFIVYLKTNDIYKDIAKDAEIRFDTSNYELDRLLPKRKN